MSYSAYVVCRCYQDGKTIKPPYEELVKFDEDGLYIDVPNEIYNRDEEEYFKMCDEFENWRATSCEHEEMEFAEEFLCNSSGLYSFINALKLGGEEKFPTVLAELPKANGGCMLPQKAKKFLEEIEFFNSISIQQTMIYLKERDTGKINAICEESKNSVFAFFNQYMYVLDKDGFSVVRREKNKNEEEEYYEVFRSKEFSIRSSDGKDAVIVDTKTDRRFRNAMILSEEKELPKVTYYTIEKAVENSAEYYRYITEPLQRLAKAAIATDNPIHWC